MFLLNVRKRFFFRTKLFLVFRVFFRFVIIIIIIFNRCCVYVTADRRSILEIRSQRFTKNFSSYTGQGLKRRKKKKENVHERFDFIITESVTCS